MNAKRTDGPMTILAVEDNPIHQQFLRIALGKEGHDATIVGSGGEALEAVGSTAFDMVLLDLNLPDMGGEAVARALQEAAQAKGYTPRIVCMSAHGKEEIAERLADACADTYLPKPIHLEALRAVLDGRGPDCT